MAYIVILRHSSQTFLPDDSICGALICNGISTIAVPLYFIISGYLFFSKNFTVNRLKHQLLRIMRLYMAWTVIYLPIIILKEIMNKTPPITAILTFIQNFIFSGSYYHLWFLPALMFAITFVSLLCSIKKRYALMIVSGLFIVGYLYEFYRFLIPKFTDVCKLYERVFLTSRNGLFFGSIYVYLGYSFSQAEIKMRQSRAAIGAAISLFMLCSEAVFMFIYRGINVMNISIFALPTSVFIFIFAKDQEVTMDDIKLLFLRRLSTALLCVHPYIIILFSYFSKHFISIPMAYFFVLIMLVGTISSAIIVRLREKNRLIYNLV